MTVNLDDLRAYRAAAGIDPDDESGWDWELLARELSRENVFLSRGLLDGASDELANRQRIWMLLSKSRLGHSVFRQAYLRRRF